MTALTAQELSAWTEATSAGFKGLLTTHPQALDYPCDIRETHNVAELVRHIVAVELRFAEHLHNLPPTGYDQVPMGNVSALYAVHDRAFALLRDLTDRDDQFWNEVIGINTRRGELVQRSRRTVFVHLHMHSIRHYAQLATLLRQHGTPPDWPMDYLFMTAHSA